jgi:hypothetical protein
MFGHTVESFIPFSGNLREGQGFVLNSVSNFIMFTDENIISRGSFHVELHFF